MQFQMPPNQGWPGQFRGLRNGFIAGLIVGMLIGWFFHGLVGLAVRFGFVLAFLIPLAIVVWFFFLRSGNRSAPQAEIDQGGVRVYTWGSDKASDRYSGAERWRSDPGPPDPDQQPYVRNEEDIIDLEFEELKRQVDDEERRS